MAFQRALNQYIGLQTLIGQYQKHPAVIVSGKEDLATKQDLIRKLGLNRTKLEAVLESRIKVGNARFQRLLEWAHVCVNARNNLSQMMETGRFDGVVLKQLIQLADRAYTIELTNNKWQREHEPDLKAEAHKLWSDNRKKYKKQVRLLQAAIRNATDRWENNRLCRMQHLTERQWKARILEQMSSLDTIYGPSFQYNAQWQSIRGLIVRMPDTYQYENHLMDAYEKFMQAKSQMQSQVDLAPEKDAFKPLQANMASAQIEFEETILWVSEQMINGQTECDRVLYWSGTRLSPQAHEKVNQLIREMGLDCNLLWVIGHEEIQRLFDLSYTGKGNLDPLRNYLKYGQFLLTGVTPQVPGDGSLDGMSMGNQLDVNVDEGNTGVSGALGKLILFYIDHSPYMLDDARPLDVKSKANDYHLNSISEETNEFKALQEVVRRRMWNPNDTVHQEDIVKEAMNLQALLDPNKKVHETIAEVQNNAQFVQMQRLQNEILRKYRGEKRADAIGLLGDVIVTGLQGHSIKGDRAATEQRDRTTDVQNVEYQH